MGIIIILFVCVYSDCPPRRRNEQGQVRWGNISRLHGGTGRKKLKRRRKKDRERILLDKKKRRKNEEGEGKRKGKQENISHLTPTVTTSASHSGFNVLWAKPPHPVHALFALTLSLSLSLSSTLVGPPASCRLDTTSQHKRRGLYSVVSFLPFHDASRISQLNRPFHHVSFRCVSLRPRILPPSYSFAFISTLILLPCRDIFYYFSRSLYFLRSSSIINRAGAFLLSL